MRRHTVGVFFAVLNLYDSSSDSSDSDSYHVSYYMFSVIGLRFWVHYNIFFWPPKRMVCSLRQQPLAAAKPQTV